MTKLLQLNPKPSFFYFRCRHGAYPFASKKWKFQTWFVNTISYSIHTLLQNANHATDHVNGVVVDDNRWSEVWQQMWNECWWWSVGVDGGWKLVGLSIDMEKAKVGSLDDMEVERMGSSDGACFGRGRCESGVRWWGTDADTTSNRAR
jgi:hypothetical protein